MKYGEVWKDNLDGEVVMIVSHEGDARFFNVLVLEPPTTDPGDYTPVGDMTLRDFEPRGLTPEWERVDDPA